MKNYRLTTSLMGYSLRAAAAASLLFTACGDDSPSQSTADTAADTTAPDVAAPDVATQGPDATDTTVEDTVVAPSWPEGPYGFAVDMTLAEGTNFVDPATDAVQSFDDVFGHPEKSVGVWFVVEGWCFSQCRAASESLIDAAIASSEIAVFYTMVRDRHGEPVWTDEASQDADRTLAENWLSQLTQRADGSTVAPPFPILLDPGAVNSDALYIALADEAAAPSVVIFRTDTMHIVYSGGYPGDEAFTANLATAMGE